MYLLVTRELTQKVKKQKLVWDWNFQLEIGNTNKKMALPIILDFHMKDWICHLESGISI